MTGPTAGRRLDIQGLRAVAVLMVVAFHAGLPVPGGFVGVDVFFVISGFVITGMLQREWTRKGRIDFRGFYLRRFKRLTPALAVMVAATVAISALVLSPLGTQQTAAKTAIGAMLLVANVVIAQTTGGYFDAPAETNPLLHTWSLSVEEQFYLVFPALITLGWLIARRGGARRPLPALLIGATAAISFGLTLLTSTGWTLPGAPWLLGFYSSLARAWEFAVGALLALALVRWRVSSRGASTALSSLGAGLLALSLWAISGETPFPGVWTLLPVAGTLLVILGGSAESNPITGWLSTRPAVKVGDWSYSIYLWHWPFIVFAGLLWPGSTLALLGAAALSFLPALASYRWIEQPIRALPRIDLWKTLAMVTGTVVIPIVLAFGVGQTATRFWIPKIQGQQGDALATPIGYELGCHYGSDKTEAPGVCTWNEGELGTPVYLVGDSNAAHYTDGLRDATASTGQPLAVSTSSSCPLLVGIELTFSGRSNYGDVCRRYVDATMQSMMDAPRGVVFLSSTDDYWLNPATGVAALGGAIVVKPTAKVELLQTALNDTVSALQGAGHEVVLVQTVPHWGDSWNLASCTLAETLEGCQQEMPVTQSQLRSEAVRSAVLLTGTRIGARVIDPASSICPGGICLTRRDDRWVYRDASHITNAESTQLAPVFLEILDDVGQQIR